MPLLSEDLIFSDLFDSDEDEKVTKKRSVLERRDFYELYDDELFQMRFRLSKAAALDVLCDIEEDLEYPSDRNRSVSPMNQLLLALRFYATGSNFLLLGDNVGVSKVTSQRIVHRVSKALSALREKHICLPNTDAELKTMQLKNYRVASFPRVLGFLDCTHVKLQSPGGEEPEVFRNRKGYFSLNVQALGDADLKFLDIVARWPGSAHDATIFGASYLKYKLDNNYFRDAVVVADSGYAVSKYVMPPLYNPIAPEEVLYNESQIRSRNCVERMFGVWKRRFPCLALGFRVKLERVFPIISATAVLHNILRARGEVEPPDDPELELPLPWEELIAMGQIQQNADEPGEPIAMNADYERRTLICDYFKRLHQFHNIAV